MKVFITRSNSKAEQVSFELEKGLQDSEAFEVLRVFTVSGFDSLSDDFVLSWPKGDNFIINDAADLKKVLNNFSGPALHLVIDEPVESEDDESYEFVTSGAVESATEEEEVSSADEEIPEKAQAFEDEEPVIEDYQAEGTAPPEEPQAEGTAPPAAEGTAPEQPSIRTRVLQLVASIGAEGMQNLVAITHSLLKEGVQLADALRVAIETSEVASSSQLVKDVLPLVDVYAAQYQHWVQMFAAFDVNNMIALIPSLVESVTRSMEGNERVELDLRPLMQQMCPQMLKKMEACIPNGQERCWNVESAARPFEVFETARADLERETGANLQVHRGITCDVCEASPIVGVRYKSVTRPDFDLCEKCEATHDPNDPLIKIKQPVDHLEFLPGFREFRRQCGANKRGPWGRRGGCRRGRGRGRCGRGGRHFWKKMMAGCNQGDENEMPCHKMKKMWKHWAEKSKAEGKPMPCEMMKKYAQKCKAEGKPSPCDMIKSHMKEMGCVNEDGSPNPHMFMQKMMKKMSAQCQNEDGSVNPCMMMKKMMGHHQEMMAKASQNWEKADGNPEKFMESMMSSHKEKMGGMFPEPSAPAPETNISAPIVRGDPTLAAFKAEKKEEIRSKKDQIRALKKEAKQCRKELKAMKKVTKLCAKVVGHLDMDEESEQVAGSCCLKTWKVKNTGSTVWPEDTFITFLKGHVKLVADGYHAIPITETVKPGEVTYIHAMLNVPNVDEGSFSVVYRLCDPNGKKFGPQLRTVINVVPAQEEEEAVVSAPPEEAARASTTSSLATARTYEEELLEEVEAEPSAPEPAFQYEAELQTLKAMGFADEEMLKGMLVANGGNVQATVAMLF
jgi:hypothetical protein